MGPVLSDLVWRIQFLFVTQYLLCGIFAVFTMRTMQYLLYYTFVMPVQCSDN